MMTAPNDSSYRRSDDPIFCVRQSGGLRCLLLLCESKVPGLIAARISSVIRHIDKAARFVVTLVIRSSRKLDIGHNDSQCIIESSKSCTMCRGGKRKNLLL
jgi:hypothetical protein